MSIYKCPVCGEPLGRDGNVYRCAHGHSYDISAKGYVNLLGSSKKNHGDDADMVASRRRFLNAGHYAPLRDKICEAIEKSGASSLLDAGCGEGYYTRRICELFPHIRVCGIDVSKKAAEKASSVCRTAHICVSSVYDMPYPDESFDCVLNVFSPLSVPEYSRLLAPGGKLILAAPMPEHLIQLKRAVYDSVFVKEMKPSELPGFILEERTDISFDMQLKREELKDLFTMTPYYHKTSECDKAKLDLIDSLDVTASFVIFVYGKA
ncbi:MAG: methyltransferase domain-containing protein [Clostridia bacterium]|nr:methyltransferase domain-containing protein [Clostridia bacterium]